MVAVLFVACQKNDSEVKATGNKLIVTGYSNIETRTAFDTPDEKTIPYTWTAGDCVWLGENKSNSIATDCTLATFEFENISDANADNGHIFYNMTGDQANIAKVLSQQSADGNLGNDGDFGYATLDVNNSFRLEHQTAYVWFDTKRGSGTLPLLTSITLSTEGLKIAGERTYDYENGEWSDAITNGRSEITLSFDGGYELKSENNGVMAAMVVLPAEVEGTNITVTYKFADGRVFSEVKNPQKNFTSGATQRVSTTINESDLYELRVLTFEDEDAKFSPMYLDYADGWSGREISTWSDLIDATQYYGPLLYGNDQMDAMYFWYDEGNTELYHMFPDNYAYCFWGGGHAISNYWGPGYTDNDRNIYIAKEYGQEYVDYWTGKPGADAALGWFLLQLMAPIAPHSGDNFCVHYGYKDSKAYIENLPEISFMDCEPRVIDHMYITNTNYTLNQLFNGVKSEEGNTFGGNWTGLTEDAWLKIVAYGYDDIDADPYEPTSETEIYLVKGFNVVEDWQRWDLSVLGPVAKVRFNFLYSDEMGGRYGFTIPGYFAYDDVAVRFDE